MKNLLLIMFAAFFPFNINAQRMIDSIKVEKISKVYCTNDTIKLSLNNSSSENVKVTISLEGYLKKKIVWWIPDILGYMRGFGAFSKSVVFIPLSSSVNEVISIPVNSKIFKRKITYRLIYNITSKSENDVLKKYSDYFRIM